MLLFGYLFMHGKKDSTVPGCVSSETKVQYVGHHRPQQQQQQQQQRQQQQQQPVVRQSESRKMSCFCHKPSRTDSAKGEREKEIEIERERERERDGEINTRKS
jgi:transcription initiation factor TFIID subunit TAF12